MSRPLVVHVRVCKSLTAALPPCADADRTQSGDDKRKSRRFRRNCNRYGAGERGSRHDGEQHSCLNHLFHTGLLVDVTLAKRSDD